MNTGDNTADNGDSAIETGDRPSACRSNLAVETPSIPQTSSGQAAIRSRIQPAAAIMPGRSDAVRLMAVWFARKSFYWMFFGGIAFGLTVATVREQDTEAGIDLGDPSAMFDELTSPWALLVLSIVLRFVVGWVALALVYPLARAHEPNLSPRTNFGSGIGNFFDRIHIARAFRALRWTHHVRVG